MRAPILLLTTILILAPGALAQQPVATPDSAGAAATQDASDYVPVPEPTEKALAYHRSGIEQADIYEITTRN